MFRGRKEQEHSVWMGEHDYVCVIAPVINE